MFDEETLEKVTMQMLQDNHNQLVTTMNENIIDINDIIK